MNSDIRQKISRMETAAVADRPPSSPSTTSTAKPSDSTPASPSPNDIDPKVLVGLLQLEGQIRSAQSVKELCFVLANETRRLLTFRQAFLVSVNPARQLACRVEAVSSVAVLDRQAPMIQWIEQVLGHLWKEKILEAPCPLNHSGVPTEWQCDWKRFAFPHVVWCPLIWGNAELLGGIWMARELPWQDGEIQLIRRVAETAAYAWQALQRTNKKTRRLNLGFQSRWLWVGAVALAVALCLPVRLSTLAPVEVVAQAPAVVTAPVEGVIAEIVVQPNTGVRKGEVLLRYDERNFKNQFDVAEKNLAVALMEYRKTSQGAFFDEETGGSLPVQATEVRLKEIEREYAWKTLQQVEVTAPRDGVVIFGDPSDWVGRPVVVGERIMEVADPQQYQLKIDLPVEDAMVLQEGADVDVFLDAHPLRAVSAKVEHASYHAEVLPTHVLAYRVKGQFIDPPADIRIGWQGTAKIYGEQVSVFFYIFRRPLSIVRQTIGL